MINAAEPVDGPALDAFTACFLGGRSDVIFPTYGLAEHTVFVCGGGQQRLWVEKTSLEGGGEGAPPIAPTAAHAPGSRELVGCGVAKHGVVVRIVDPERRRPLPAGCVGEIWVDSPSKAQGYWGHPQETAETFQARLAPGKDEDTDREFLRTGDLGFLYTEELFVCGRLKDLLIIRGRNHYPQDLEKAAERAAPDLLRPGCSAAFAVPSSSAPKAKGDQEQDGGEEEAIVLVAEVREDVASASHAGYPALAQRLFQTLSREDGVLLSHLLLCKPRTVPKTTSGKIARRWCQKAFVEGSFQTVYAWQASSAEAASVTEGGDTAPEATGAAATTAADDAVMPLPPPLEPLAEGAFASMPMDEVIRQVTVLTRHALGEAQKTRLWAHPHQAARVPLPALGMDSLAAAQLKAAVETHFGSSSLPEELYFREDTSIGHIAALLYAVGHGHLTPQDAWEQYDEVLRQGGGGGDEGGTMLPFDMEMERAPANRLEWVIQMCPCCLLFPCCR